MALAHHDPLRFRRGTPTPRLGGKCHHGRSDLAEVVPIRPAPELEHSAGSGQSRGPVGFRDGRDFRDARSGGMMRRIAQAFAPLRVQLTTGASPPRPSSSATPSLRVLAFAAVPDDVA
jgi:hypothetical protein